MPRAFHVLEYVTRCHGLKILPSTPSLRQKENELEFTMTRIVALVFGALTALSTATANPYRHTARVDIENKTSETVCVYRNQAFAGCIHRGDERRYALPPGRHDIEVRNSRNELVLDKNKNFRAGENYTFNVVPPRGTLLIDHPGGPPLLVQLAGLPNFWLLPGQSKLLNMETGRLQLTTFRLNSRGQIKREQHEVRIRSGKQTSVNFQRNAPPATRRTTLINQTSSDVRLYIDGEEMGRIAAGGERTLRVDPGAHQVLIVESRGDVVFLGNVDLSSNANHRLRNGRLIPTATPGSHLPPRPNHYAASR